MYTFDLLRAEMLIAHANVCTEMKGRNAGALFNSIAALAEKSLSEAQKLILNAKPVAPEKEQS